MLCFSSSRRCWPVCGRSEPPHSARPPYFTHVGLLQITRKSSPNVAHLSAADPLPHISLRDQFCSCARGRRTNESVSEVGAGWLPCGSKVEESSCKSSIVSIGIMDMATEIEGQQSVLILSWRREGGSASYGAPYGKNVQ